MKTIEWATELSDPFKQSNFPEYKTMAAFFYQQYQLNLASSKQYVDDNNQYYLSQMTQQDMNNFSCYESGKRKFCISTIIFEALACEAFLNWFGEIQLGSEAFAKMDKNPQTRSTLKKVKLIPESKLGKSFPTDSPTYQKLELLMNTRNSLAHNKLCRVSFDMEPEEFLLAIGNAGVKDESIYSIVDEVIGTCQLVQDEMLQLRNDEDHETK